MKKIILTTALALIIATPAMAKDYIIKEVSNPDAKQPYYFDPANLTIQPGDTVSFINAQDEMHDVMFVEVPKGINEMIMSPMHEKKGDKFSYQFTVPGTYKFHCHPHEKLGMKGTLIVGAPSKKGETVLMDHHKMAKIHDVAMKNEAKASGDVAKGPQGTGIIKSVDAGAHKIIVKHDPIAELGWPVMTMEFVVEPAVDLGSVHEGDKIRFILKAKGDEDYSITKIQKN